MVDVARDLENRYLRHYLLKQFYRLQYRNPLLKYPLEFR